MTRWLETRPLRERRLIALALLLALAVGLWQGVYAPLADYRARERRAWKAATDRLAEIEETAAEILVLRHRQTANLPPDTDRSIRSVVSETARPYGLTLSRLAPERDGRLGVWFERAQATDLFEWIAMLDRRFGIDVARAAITANADGPTVRAQITLGRTETAS